MRLAILLILAALAAPQAALAQAAANPVLRYKAVIDNLRNKDSSNAELDRITSRLLPLAVPNTNTSGWTNTQKATALLDYLRLHVRSMVVGAAGDQERAASAVQSAIDAAGVDID